MNDWATPTTALVYARIALNLRQRDAMNAALDHLAAHLKNPWVQLMDASIRYQLGEESAASLVTRAIENVDLPVVIRDRWWALAARMGRSLLGELSHHTANSRYTEDYPVELAWTEEVTPNRTSSFVATIVDRADLDVSTAVAVVDHLLSEGARHSTFRRAETLWHDISAEDCTWSEGFEGRVIAAAREGRGFSLIRLGDGEGLMLDGRRPNLGGALGRDERGGLRQLDLKRYAAFRREFRDAISAADIIGVPDLGQCLNGPTHYAKAVAGALQSETDRSRIVPGASWAHYALEATGAMSRLAPYVSGVISPVDPREMSRSVRLRQTVQWLRVPGEAQHYLKRGGAEHSHFDSYYRAIMEREFASGQVWLVGAGILGKLYCRRIQECGSAAIDVGALMDLWGGRQDTRGGWAFNPWVAVPHRRLAQLL